ncbi:MAG: hypothetical protein HWE09_01870 [Cyclobacteriaceae bacterium]|nr:hypothetical protein [Cyclobacteriaceae bacterium]
MQGNVAERRTFDAFGKPRTERLHDTQTSSEVLLNILNSEYSNRGFTDHEHFDSAQLIHMNGRAYDYNLGRFLSVDPFIQDPGNSQSMNPYSYIMNNPLAGTDPSGYLTVCQTFIVCSKEQKSDPNYNKPISEPPKKDDNGKDDRQSTESKGSNPNVAVEDNPSITSMELTDLSGDEEDPFMRSINAYNNGGFSGYALGAAESIAVSGGEFAMDMPFGRVIRMFTGEIDFWALLGDSDSNTRDFGRETGDVLPLGGLAGSSRGLGRVFGRWLDDALKSFRFTKSGDELADYAHNYSRSAGAMQRVPTVLQSGGNKLSNRTSKGLNDYFGENLTKRDWGRALEGLKKDLGLRNDHHGRILDNGDYINDAGELLANISHYLP